MEFPKAVEMIQPAEFKGSLAIEEQIVNQKMIEAYVPVMFISALLLTMALLI